MGRLFDAGGYDFTLLSLPQIALALSMLWVLAYLAFTRGHELARVALFAAVLSGAIWSFGQVLTMWCTHEPTALLIARLAFAPVSLVGPAALALVLAVGNRLHHHRGVLALAIAASLVTAVLTVTTDLMLKGVWLTPFGFFYPEAGLLNGVHLGNLVVWAIVGAVLGARGARRDRARVRRRGFRRLAVAAGLVAVSAADTLLAYRIGVYPLAWAPLLVVNGLLLYTLIVGDLIRARGRDWATGWEIGVVLAMAAYVFAIYVGTSDIRTSGMPVLSIVLLVPALGIAQATAVTIRARASAERSSADRELTREVDAFAERSATHADATALAADVGDLLQRQLRLTSCRLYVARRAGDGGAFTLATDTAAEEPAEYAIDARVRAWLVANPQPLLAERLETARLGGLRDLVQKSMAALDAEVLLPLVDRDALVGMIITDERDTELALRDHEIDVLVQLQEATARALTYMKLYREAAERIGVEREVEIAAAVQYARIEGATRTTAAGCEIVSEYQPASQFGGDWWTSAELSDGRLLIVIGDVTGHGVAAALVTATVEGCCETARHLFGSGFNVFDLLQLLNRSVLDVGGSRYLMSCFAALVDPDRMAVTFANAGHPFPYLCRAPEAGGDRSELRALVSRGMPLGVEREPVIAVSELPLRERDVLVFYTDALVESEDDEGARYGDRKLQRALRTHAHRAGARIVEEVMGDARAHYGDHPIREDITLVCVRIGRG